MRKAMTMSPRPTRSARSAWLLCVLAVLIMSAGPAARSAHAGRARLHQLESGGYTAEDVRAEVEFGRRVAARILGRFGLYEDPQLNRYVALLGTGLAGVAGRPELRHRFAVLDTDLPNAFAAPGGYVFITRGAIERMENEAELAAVLSHEISHVSRRHIVRQLGIRGDNADAIGGLARVIGGAGEAGRVAMSNMIDAADDILFGEGYSIEDENEADRDALVTVGQVGYDPAALSRFIARLERETVVEPASIRATHPAWNERAQNLDQFLSSSGLDGHEGAKMKGRFDENSGTR